jgi:hypothetical protein
MHLSAIRRLLSAGLAAVAAALVCSVVSAAPAIPASDKKPESPAERVRRILDQTAESVEIENQPLTLAINQLREQTKLNLVLDTMTIQLMGIDPTNQQGNGVVVNVKLENVKWKTVLRTILGQYNLSYAVIGDTVHITSEEAAMYKQMHQRVNVDLDKVPLAGALKQLAKDTATNLLVDNRVQKESQNPVTLQLEDVPLETAVRLMAEMAGLRPVRVGNVLFVTTKATAAEIKADVESQPGQPQPGRQALEDIIVPGQGQIQIAVPAGAPVQPAQPAPKPSAPATAPADVQKTESPDKPADAPPMDKDAKPADKPASDKDAKPAPPADKPKDADKR